MNKFWLILILLLAIGVRFYRLGSSPAGFYVDEAAIGYNAFSLMETGKDEYGKTMPVLLRSFSVYAAPVYSYFLIPIYRVLGMSVYTTRLLSAIAGVLTALMLYLLVRKVGESEMLARMAALMLAISPWSILFSRTTYESNLALLFLVTTVYCWYRALEKKWWWIVVAVMGVMAMLSYQAERIVVPLLFLCLGLYSTKKILIKSNFWPILISLVVGLGLMWPTLMVVGTDGFMSRATTLNIFNYSHQNPSGYAEKLSGVSGKVANFKPWLTLKEFGSLYISYFSPRYLFNLGDAGPRSSYPDLSTFYVWQLPFYLYGWWWVVRGNKFRKLKVFVIPWLVIAPLPAAMTRDPYSTIRSLTMVIPLVIMVAVGVERFLKIKWANLVIIVLLGYSFCRLGVSVWIQNDYLRYSQWDYGLEQVADKIKENNNKVPIFFDSFNSLAYIQTVFFLKYDPVSFQKENALANLENYYNDMKLAEYKYMGKVSFGNLDWSKAKEKGVILIAGPLGISDDQAMDHNLSLLWEIKGPDGAVLYRGFGGK